MRASLLSVAVVEIVFSEWETCVASRIASGSKQRIGRLTMKSLLLLILFWSSLPPPPPAADAFNLAWKIPVIKSGGLEDGYFGFSVAQHRTELGSPRILVGAPRDQNLQPGTNRSGALYQCPLTSAIEVGRIFKTNGRLKQKRSRITQSHNPLPLPLIIYWKFRLWSGVNPLDHSIFFFL